MELTNYSFLNSRNDYNSSLKLGKNIAKRISSGDKLINKEDVGALGQKIGLRSDRLQVNSRRISLKTLSLFLILNRKVWIR